MFLRVLKSPFVSIGDTQQTCSSRELNGWPPRQVRPNIPKDVYDYMRNKLRRAKDQASADPVVQSHGREIANKCTDK